MAPSLLSRASSWLRRPRTVVLPIQTLPREEEPPLTPEELNLRAILSKSQADLLIPAVGGHIGTEKPDIQPYPQFVADLQLMAMHCAPLAAIVQAVRNEVLRHPPEVEPAFGSKCLNALCLWEGAQVEISCPECGGETRQPSELQKARLEQLLQKPSNEARSFLELLEWLEDDLNILDDAFVCLHFDYLVEHEGEILAQALVRVERLEPSVLGMVADRRGRWLSRDGQGWFTCVLHRENNVTESPEPCRVCGKAARPVRWVAFKEASRPEIGYFDWEVIHWSRYKPSPKFGFSPVLSNWDNAKTLVNFARQVSREAEQQRPPKGILVFITSNYKSLRDQLAIEDDLVRRNPNHIPKVAVESTSDKGGVQWVPFTLPASEQQIIEQTKQKILEMAAIYGVSPVQLNQAGGEGGGGGLNNERLQLEVSGRTTQRAHSNHQERFFDPLAEAAGCSDWRIRFPEAIERDEQVELNERKLNLDMINTVLGMGGQIRLEDEGNWKFSIENFEELMQKPETSPFGGPEGPGGGLPGGEAPQQPSDEAREDMGKRPEQKQLQKESAREAFFRQALDETWKRLLPELSRQAVTWRDPAPAKAAAEALIDKVVNRLAGVAEGRMSEAFLAGFKEAGVAPAEALLLRPALRALTEASPLWEAFAGMKQSATVEIHGVIERAFTSPLGLDLRTMVRQMREVVNAETFRLERIARNETQVVLNQGRAMGYAKRDPESQFRYRWEGPADFRTTKCCERIKARVPQAGLALEELGVIVKEEGLKEMADYPPWVYREWHPHFSCRHGLRRVVLALSGDWALEPLEPATGPLLQRQAAVAQASAPLLMLEVLNRVQNPEFEGKHPRASDGRFGSKPGQHAGPVGQPDEGEEAIPEDELQAPEAPEGERSKRMPAPAQPGVDWERHKLDFESLERLPWYLKGRGKGQIRGAWGAVVANYDDYVAEHGVSPSGPVSALLVAQLRTNGADAQLAKVKFGGKPHYVVALYSMGGEQDVGGQQGELMGIVDVTNLWGADRLGFNKPGDPGFSDYKELETLGPEGHWANPDPKVWGTQDLEFWRRQIKKQSLYTEGLKKPMWKRGQTGPPQPPPLKPIEPTSYSNVYPTKGFEEHEVAFQGGKRTLRLDPKLYAHTKGYIKAAFESLDPAIQKALPEGIEAHTKIGPWLKDERGRNIERSAGHFLPVAEPSKRRVRLFQADVNLGSAQLAHRVIHHEAAHALWQQFQLHGAQGVEGLNEELARLKKPDLMEQASWDKASIKRRHEWGDSENNPTMKRLLEVEKGFRESSAKLRETPKDSEGFKAAQQDYWRWGARKDRIVQKHRQEEQAFIEEERKTDPSRAYQEQRDAVMERWTPKVEVLHWLSEFEQASKKEGGVTAYARDNLTGKVGSEVHAANENFAEMSQLIARPEGKGADFQRTMQSDFPESWAAFQKLRAWWLNDKREHI